MGHWAKVQTAETLIPADSMGGCVFVNQKGSPDLGCEILQLISSASRSIDIINPLVTDQRIVQALIKARERRVRIRVITELRDNRGSGVSYPTRGFEGSDAHALKEHFDSIRELARRQVLCRGLLQYAHAKLLLVDGQVAMMSSVNLTANSLGWGTHSSLEAGVRIDVPDHVAAWARAVMAIWDSCPFRLHLLGSDVSLQQEGAATIDFHALESESSPECHVMWSIPPAHYDIRNRLVDLCDAATRQIILSAMSFYDVDHVPQLHSAIVHALRRGVAVKVIVRPEHFKSDQYPDASTLNLIEQGLQLLGRSGLHAKGITVDSAMTAILSANINPFSLANSDTSAHVECGMIGGTQGPCLLGNYGQLLEWLADHPTHRYVTH